MGKLGRDRQPGQLNPRHGGKEGAESKGQRARWGLMAGEHWLCARLASLNPWELAPFYGRGSRGSGRSRALTEVTQPERGWDLGLCVVSQAAGPSDKRLHWSVVTDQGDSSS